MIEKDSIPIGLLLGAVFPVLGYVGMEYIIGILVENGSIAGLSGNSYDRRMRTILLIAICCNLIPFTVAQKQRWDQTMRGITFPTMIYVAYWLYRYNDTLF